MKTTDYTKLPIGTKVEDGTIQLCPHCGRHGVAEEVYGKTFFTHSYWRGYDQRDNPQMGWDMCPKQTIALTTSPPE